MFKYWLDYDDYKDRWALVPNNPKHGYTRVIAYFDTEKEVRDSVSKENEISPEKVLLIN